MSCAPIAIANACATRSGIHRSNRETHHGATTISPAVASTDSTNPSCAERNGSITSSTTTAAASAPTERR